MSATVTPCGSPVTISTREPLLTSPGSTTVKQLRIPLPNDLGDVDRLLTNPPPTSAAELNYLILKAVMNGCKRRLRRFPLVQTTLAEAVSSRILHS